MPSKAQIEANRENAAKSTGPKTAGGKTASSRNATRHGLTGKQVVIQGEDPAAFEALRRDLIEAYAPANAAEEMLVDEIAQSFWRLQRARALEAESFKLHGAGADSVIAFRSAARDFDNIRRYMTTIERAYHRAIQQLETSQSIRRRAEFKVKPSAPARDENGFVLQSSPAQRSSKPNLAILPRREGLPNHRGTIKFDPLPSPTATSKTQ